MSDRNGKQTDHFLEVVFSYTRWFFLCVAAFVYLLFYASGAESHLSFILLVVFGVLYMGVTQLFLHKSSRESRLYEWITKGGVVFDLIAYPWLIAVTGGFHSPFVPVGYLIVLHAILYWRYKGGIAAAITSTAGFSGVLTVQGQVFDGTSIIVFITNTVILFLFAIIGGVIISRERKHYAERLAYEQMARRDYLTGLYNHRTFQEHLQTYTEQNEPFYLVMADIDHFKRINDTYGHVTGDKVLKKIGETFREMDFNGAAYRYGGEEFALLVKKAGNRPLPVLLKKISEGVDRRNRAILSESRVTLSYGCLLAEGGDPEKLIRLADTRLYKAKAGGKDQAVGLEEVYPFEAAWSGK
ncbi:GGDEF domain-containing protein [Alteribacter natronophilus]|uniref:GGDEF domain-containing protein n=1 Tax=Alteribacter natronophilus TaxID=2583810 RepID=UPI00110DADB7|nr:GGDEF domain-containing protein [Alteribacter natronophilus]TMW72091.1 GGDEF domain-containing protein [Alteribacter natronophilus]